jgi:hypothetical protein
MKNVDSKLTPKYYQFFKNKNKAPSNEDLISEMN